MHITNADFAAGIRGWNETTSTSPSGRHLGHYRALIQDYLLLDMEVKFLNIALSRGISLQRWSQSINVMIEKDECRPAIHRLRIIHLFEADYNYILKLMWGSRLVRHASAHNLINHNQHGSQNGKTAMDPILLKELTCDISRQLRHSLATFNNDASACYDRIIIALAMLAARRWGMPPEAVSTHASALEFMQYRVKTIYGISEDNYTGTPFEPLFGTGQGSGASPAAWLSLIVILLNTIDRLVPERMQFKSPSGHLSHARLADAFVDDTCLGFTDEGKLTPLQLVERLKIVAQTWERLLHYSGGSLNLKKCFWYVQSWRWPKGRPTQQRCNIGDPQVRLTSGTSDKRIPITRHELDTPHRTLGVHLDLTGDFSEQIEVLRLKAGAFTIHLKRSRLTPHLTRTFHKSVYAPAITYPLPAIAADEEDLQCIQTQIIPEILNHMGYPRTLPREVRHGPKSMGGVELLDVRTEYGIKVLQHFRDAVFAGGEVGKLMTISLQYSQLECGMPGALLEHPSKHYAYLTPTWVLSMRQFLYQHGITVKCTDILEFELCRQRDGFIMEYADSYPEQHQHDINLVRQFLGVTLLSNISNANGTEIVHDVLEGRIQHHRTSSFQWPRQPYVTKDQIRRWRAYLQDHFISMGNNLKQSLGLWTKHPVTEWRYHYDPVTETLQDQKSKRTASLVTSTGKDHCFSQWQTSSPDTTWTFYPVDPIVTKI